MTDTNEYKGPLTGLNVIDFGWYYAGPMAGMLLADQGANVIRIVKPGEKELPEQQYRLLNRNKKLLTLDLKSEEGKNNALSLIECADVVIENFRPGVMKRLGLDYASIKQKNPSLVYLSLPGFASTDKERAHLQAWEGIMGAAACVYTTTSVYRDFLGYPPVYTAVPHCSVYGAVNGALAVMAALIARERQSAGTVLEVPLVSAGITAFEAFAFLKPPSWQYRFDPKAKFQLPLAYEGSEYSPADDLDTQKNKIARARCAYSEVYGLSRPFVCADGREIYLYPLSYKAPLQWLFFEKLGIAKQLKEEGFVQAGRYETHLDNNLSLFMLLSADRKQRVLELVTGAFQTRTAEQWEDILSPIMPATMIRTRAEWLSLKPLLESGVLVCQKNDHSELIVPGRLADASSPCYEPSTPNTSSLFPLSGEEALLSAYREAVVIDYSKAQELFSHNVHQQIRTGNNSTPLKKGDLLKGLKVLDLANMVAGPSVSMNLSQFGADVITPFPLDAKHYHPTFPLTNTGKRTLLVDIATEPGRHILHQLVSSSDLVVHNCLDGTAERVGAGHRQLQTINPNIVTCQVSGFGGTWRGKGGWENRPAIEHTAQAATGIMTQYGTLEVPQVHGQISCADTLGGPGGAFAALLGIYQKLKTGYAGETRTSLARLANFVQLPWMISENGNSDWGEARGQFALGETSPVSDHTCWWQRLYQCRDGWIYVGTPPDQSDALAEAITGHQKIDDEIISLAMEAGFAEKDCEAWLKQLDRIQIAAHRVLNFEDIMQDSPMRHIANEASHETAQGGTDILCWDDHPCGHPFTLLAPDHVRVGQDQTYWRITPAPRFGEHTREVLQELGYTQEEIDKLVHLKIAHDYFPMFGRKDIYLPGFKVRH